ncbi:MAG: hypothetical protein GWP14_02955 [Actinobacteria bacterium]|nr:hypothetical protein [Actinomycetota bacterium]
MDLNIGNIVKQHRYETVCVVLALVILLALWPASRLGSQAREKTEELRSWNVRLKKSMNSRGLANPSVIQERNNQAQALADQAEEIAGLLRQKNQRPFLVEDIFTDSPDPGAPMRFRTSYRQAIEQLLSKTLRAGWPDDKGDTASSIVIYARDDDLNIGAWESDNDLPDAEDCWFAQLDLWIQQDLAEVFGELNRNSAQQRGQQPSVLNAAVKRIISIYVDPYYYVGLNKQPGQAVPGAVPFGGPGAINPMGGGIPPGQGQVPWQPAVAAPRVRSAKDRARARVARRQEKPFTERFSDDKVDVLHFSFSVVVDSRRVNELLAALSRQNLYTILKVSLSRADVNIDVRKFPKFDSSAEAFSPYDDAEEEGLVYGTDPVVRLDVDVEALFLRDIYVDYMPKAVKDVLSAETDEAKQQRLDVQEARRKAQAAAKKKARKKGSKKKQTRSRRSKK